jgi:hypothetical protein
MKRFLTWFNGQTTKTRVVLIVSPILVALIVVIELWTTPSSGRVLAEGKNLGAFEASENPFKFDSAHARRFVITKIEAFGPGVLDDFPPDCGVNTCSSTPPDKRPIVVIWTDPEPRCSGGSAEDFGACVAPLTNQCGLARTVSQEPFTYIWWRRDSAGTGSHTVALTST